MIYLTVGSYQEGFNRLVRKIDELCGRYNTECIAQIGMSSYKPVHMQYKDFYVEEEHLSYIVNSKFTITHGGFGVIGDTMRLNKPMIIAPRRLNEGPNDQVEMAKQISAMYDIELCLNIDDIESQFLKLLHMNQNIVSYNLKNNVSLIISDFLKNN